jgi:hypothetical protein
VLRPPVCYQRPGSLTLMRVEAVSTTHDSPLALWVVEKLLIGYRDVYNGCEDTLSVGCMTRARLTLTTIRMCGKIPTAPPASPLV